MVRLVSSMSVHRKTSGDGPLPSASGAIDDGSAASTRGEIGGSAAARHEAAYFADLAGTVLACRLETP